ncbi:hypothetical protein F5144DRAFT_563330, partial [Chaetomium tenue]
MNHTTPIPVALCCKDARLAQSVCERLLPDLDGTSPYLSSLSSSPLAPPSLLFYLYSSLRCSPTHRLTHPRKVIHVCLDLPTALAELPLLFSPMTGETTNPTATPPTQSSPPPPRLPASGLGSNSTHRPP